MYEEMDDDMASRHKKEKKDLQAKITFMKKMVTKGDKKKKKEVAEEISHLEKELEERQAEELRQFSNSTMEEVESDESKNLISNGTECALEKRSHKVSKAQRRREKKAILIKVREQKMANEIDEDDLGIKSKRIKETEIIKSILKKKGLDIHEIAADGNCMYSAVAHQLNNDEDVEELRKKAAEELRQNVNDYLPFLTNSDTGNILSLDEFEVYCDKVAQTTTWGGQLELRALSQCLKRQIEVVQAEGPPVIIGGQEMTNLIILTYHRHMYRLGEHYNSVIPLTPNESGD